MMHDSDDAREPTPSERTNPDEVPVRSDVGPFRLVPDWIYDELTPTELAVFLALSRFADQRGACYPSYARLAEVSRLSVATVKRALLTMRRAGIVSSTSRRRADGGQTSSLYHLHLSRPLELEPARLVDVSRAAPGSPASLPPGSPVTDEREPRGTRERALSSSRDDRPTHPASVPVVWDALVAELGYEPTTKTERSLVGKCVRELRDAGATPGEIRDRAREYRARFPGIQLTAPAFVKHWSSLAERGGNAGTTAHGAAGPSRVHRETRVVSVEEALARASDGNAAHGNVP